MKIAINTLYGPPNDIVTEPSGVIELQESSNLPEIIIVIGLIIIGIFVFFKIIKKKNKQKKDTK